MDMESKMKRQEVDCITGEIFEIPLTAEEIKEYEKRVEDAAKAIADAEAKAEADEEAKIELEAKRLTAIAKLTALGLTADDLKALGLA